MKRLALATVLLLGSLNAVSSQAREIGYDELGDLDFRADLNLDGYINFGDVKKLAAVWLEQTCGLFEPCERADIFPYCGSGDVQFHDYARLAQQWEMCTDVTNPACTHLPLSLKEPPTISTGHAFPLSCSSTCLGTMLETVPTNPAHGVNLSSGEFHETQVDLRIAGRGFDFVWGRTFRSRTGTTTEIGNGWDYSYNIKLEACGADLILHSGNGRRDLYSYQPDGTWTAKGFFRVLSQRLDTSFELAFADKTTWRFNPLDESSSQGKITAITDRNGNAMSFTYDGSGRLVTVSDTLDRDVSIVYDGNGLIALVNDWTGREVQYSYYNDGDAGGSFGDLKSVRSPVVVGTPTDNDFPDGKTTVYTYSVGLVDERLNHNLVTITDANGQTWLANSYSEAVADPNFDHVVRQVLGDANNIIDVTYVRHEPNADNGYAVTRAITNDGIGNVAELMFDNRNQLVIERRYTGRANPDAPTSLDPDVNPPVGKLRVSDPDYFETRYQYNSEHLCTRIDYGNGNYVTNVYEVDLDPSVGQRSLGNLRERHQFAGALEPVSDQNEIVELFEYGWNFGGCGCGGTNFVIRHVNGDGYETLHEYDPNGNRTRTTNVIPSEPNIVEQWEYNTYGQVTKHFLPDDGNGPQREDRYEYYTVMDGTQNGYLKQVVLDVNGLEVTTGYTYDSVGNVLTQTDPNGDTTSYTVNELDQIVVETAPAPYSYQKKYFYDVRDNVIEVDRPFGGGSVSTLYEYDSLGRRIRVEQQVGDGNTVTTRYQYDDNGNLATIIDDRGNVTETDYDERDLVFLQTRGAGEPEASTERRNYDKNGNPDKLYDGNGNLAVDRDYDGFNRVVAKTDPCGNSESFTYDAAGNQTSSSDKNGRVTTYEYDSLDRLVRVTDPCGYTQEYRYDAAGNEKSSTDENGFTTTYEYDALYRVTRISDACGYSDDYTYDDKGNRTGASNRNGYMTTYEYDTLSRLVRLTDPCLFSESYGYDESGNRTRLEDKNGFVTTYEYDALGRLTRVTDPCTHTETRKYDGAGNRTSFTDKNGHTTSYEYDALDRLIRVTDPCGSQQNQSYDRVGNRTSLTDKNGNTTTYEYDSLNRLTRVTDPCGFTQRMTYDPEGNKTSDTDKRGHTTTYEYDSLDRIIRATDPCGFSDVWVYHGIKKFEDITDKNGHTSTKEFDEWANIVESTDPCGGKRRFTYDPEGNKTAEIDPNGNLTTYSYDPLNRLISKTDALGNSTLFSYDPAGNRTSVTDANGSVTTYSYDPLNRLIKRTDDLSYETKYSYDPVGNRISVTDARNKTTTYTYDSLDRLVRVTSPMGRSTAYEYDKEENIVKRIDADGGTTTYEYDGLNRLVLLTQPDTNSVTTEYDGQGNVTRIANTGELGETTSNSYDVLNRLASTETDYGGLFVKTANYSYDPVGNRISMDADGSVTVYEYDALDRLVRITDPCGNATQYEYDVTSRRTKMTRQNGIETTYSYDPVGNLLKLANRKSWGELISSYDYTYDPVGNRLTMTDSYTTGSFMTWYTYDSLYRLVRVDTSWGDTRRYSYDGVDNRLDDIANGTPTYYSYDSDNRLLSAGLTTYAYDNRGNVTSKTDPGGMTSYRYNNESKLTGVTPPLGSSVAFQYSGTGKRLSKSASPTTYYSYTCWYCPGCCQWYCDIIAEYNDVGQETVSYASGPQIDEHISLTTAGSTYYYVGDGLGNVTAITDQFENLVASYEYDAFGNITYQWGAIDNAFTYTGREMDYETGLYNYNQRYYDPQIGRFTSQDPIGPQTESRCGGGGCDAISAEMPEQLKPQHHYPPIQEGGIDNRYVYVGNNPVNRVDPLGLYWWPIADASVAGSRTSWGRSCGGGAGGCSSSRPLLDLPTGRTKCLHKVYGKASCDLKKPSCSPHDIKNNNNTCTRECTQKHEEQHDKDMKDCCDKARDAWADAANQAIAGYRGRRLGSKTLARKIENVDSDRKVVAARSAILNNYDRYVDGARAWAECRAYGVSIQCADDLWDKYNCDCPKPEDKQCCKDIEEYKKNAEKQKKSNCKKKGAKKPPKCPF